MKRHGWLILLAFAACTPQYQSGKTQCSDKRECPGGYSCSDDGTNAVHYCVENKKLGCADTTTFYCSQSSTCWAKPGACGTVTYCGTTKHPGSVICASPNYHPDCNGDVCLPNGALPDGGTVTGKGGAGGSIVVGVGGRLGSGGTAGNRDAGVPDARAGGGVVGVGGIIGYGGAPLARGGTPGMGASYGTGGATGRGGTVGYGGAPPIRGGTVGYGGTIRTGGSGGITGRGGSSGTVGPGLCSGAPTACTLRTEQWECQYTLGCVWNVSTETCSGTPSACGTNTASTTCILNGCTWSGALTCNKTPVTDICTSMAPSTPCETCFIGSCCGQLVACMNDTTCLNTSSGPLWNAYLDCAANCCYGSCTF
jgi:hypothetical protein